MQEAGDFSVLEPALDPPVNELFRPVLGVDAVAVAQKAGQIPEFAEAVAQAVMARLENVTAGNVIEFSYFRVDREDVAAHDVIDRIGVEINRRVRAPDAAQQQARHVVEDMRLWMIDRIHEAAAPRPAQEIGTEIQAELMPLLEQGVSRALPNLEIAERVEDLAPEQPERRLRRQSGAVSKKGESRMIRPGRAIDEMIASGRIGNQDQVGVIGAKGERREPDGATELVLQHVAGAPAQITRRKVLGEDVVVGLKRPRQRPHVRPGLGNDRKLRDLRLKVEQPHRIGDAKTLAIADHGNAWTGCLSLQHPVAPPREDLSVECG